MNNDFYCESIISGKIPVKIIGETEKVLAFMHTNPSWEFHAVIIPKEHIATLTDLENSEISKDIFEVAKEIILKEELNEKNFKLITNGGNYQSTKHLHFHLVSGRPLDENNPAQKGEMLV